MRMIVLGGLAASLALAGAAAAQPMGHHGRPDANGDGKVSLSEMQSRHDQAFERLDLNHDGKLTQAEADQAREQFRAAMRDKMFARIDTNSDGQISRAEFNAAGDQRQERRGERRMQHGRDHPMGLARLDANGDGSVSKSEYDARLADHFKAMDKNGDGVISPDERRMGRHHRGGAE